MQPAVDARDVPLAQLVAATLDEVDGEGVEQLVGDDDALDGVGLGEPVGEQHGVYVVAARGEGGALLLDAPGVAVEDGDARGGVAPRGTRAQPVEHRRHERTRARAGLDEVEDRGRA